MFIKKKKVDMSALPKHIAIIMDGNGRWAQQRGLPRHAGHSVGAETFRKIATYCKKIGIQYLTVYAFSTENWKRSSDEVNAILNLFRKYIEECLISIKKEGIRIYFKGDLTPFPADLRNGMNEVHRLSDDIEGPQVNICVNYGGRAEIIDAVKAIALKVKNNEINVEVIDDELISRHIYMAGIPDPDLIIRPGREIRISNFLTWEGVYSEYYFTEKLWPDFKENDIDEALISFQSRKRRFGGV